MILFLGGDGSRELFHWLKQRGETIEYIEDAISVADIGDPLPDHVISYNYRHLLPVDAVQAVRGRAINLHISYLPFNRGAHPNVWSFLEDTPKGVSIHFIDNGIDTGDILLQQLVDIDEAHETLRSSYELLHRNIQSLFQDQWARLRSGAFVPQPQAGEGSIHFRKDYQAFAPFMKDQGWDTPVRVFKARYQQAGHHGNSNSNADQE